MESAGILWHHLQPQGGVLRGHREMRQKVEEVTEELESMRLGIAVRTVREGFVETLVYTKFPPERWRRIRMKTG